jgi:hypothetical protein
MKTKLLFLAIAPAVTTALSQTFPVADPDKHGTEQEKAIAIEEGKTYTVRGVVNVVHFPIADGDQHGTEQGSVTVGYFLLFTPERYTVNGTDADENGKDKQVQIKDQQIFQLAPDDKQIATIEGSVGKPVEMKVEVFLRHTMYHKTPVLFTVLSVKVLEGAKGK